MTDSAQEKMPPSIQETTIVPTEDGYAVQIYVSEQPPSDEGEPDLAITLHVRIARKDRAMTLPEIQLEAIHVAFEALKPVMASLY